MRPQRRLEESTVIKKKSTQVLLMKFSHVDETATQELEIKQVL